MEQGTVFKSNGCQAVRLPKSIALPNGVTRVDIVAMGRARLLVPVGEAWDNWFDGDGVTVDYMECRDQPVEQSREKL
ncbi:MAG: type II toxin-antitoxin system VapB family antitoxin [Noviherbaspirillum sp.]